MNKTLLTQLTELEQEMRLKVNDQIYGSSTVLQSEENIIIALKNGLVDRKLIIFPTVLFSAKIIFEHIENEIQDRVYDIEIKAILLQRIRSEFSDKLKLIIDKNNSLQHHDKITNLQHRIKYICKLNSSTINDLEIIEFICQPILMKYTYQDDE